MPITLYNKEASN